MPASVWSSGRLLLRLAAKHWVLAVSGGLAGLAGWAIDIWDVPKLPFWVFEVVGALLLLAAVVRAFHDVRVEGDASRDELAMLNRSRPNLVLKRQKWVPLFGQGQYLFHALQIWFCNEPEVRGPNALAKNVSVQLAIYKENETLPLQQITSQWVNAFDPEAAGYSSRSPQIDIPANDSPAKFFLVLQHPATEADCYLFSFAVLQGIPDGRAPKNRVPPGRYRVVAIFKGDNIEQEITMRFVNHGQQSEPEVVGVPKAHLQDAEPSPAPTDADV